MRKIDLKSITGFRVKDVHTPIVIRDARGIMFYDTTLLVPKVQYFNMPVGIFYVESGYFVPTFSPRVYPLAKLPKPERNRRRPFDFKIEFANNPNKCSIIWDEKRIVFDNSFWDKPLPEIWFIYYHEIGHALYETEEYADLYASNMMKKRGYNPSQICYAHINSLSSANFERKQFLNKILIETL